MKTVCILFLFLFFPIFAFAQYKVVLKSGKVIEGEFLSEDEKNIYLESGGIQMNFKKEMLDLEKMEALNSAAKPTAMPSKKSSETPSSTQAKKTGRVYTTEDLQRMKQIWEENSPQTVPSSQTEPTSEAQDITNQAQPTASEEPRDEKTIRDELELTRSQIAETEKRIKDLRAKNRVVETWEKMLAKQKQTELDLQAELKAAKKAGKKAAQTQPQQ